jgi:hypothetical protein
MDANNTYVMSAGRPFGLATLTWEYNPEPQERFFSFFISGAQCLPNGNTLVNQGAGAKVREVTPAGDIVCEHGYVHDGGAPDMLFRALRYPADHPGIKALLAMQE